MMDFDPCMIYCKINATANCDKLIDFGERSFKWALYSVKYI